MGGRRLTFFALPEEFERAFVPLFSTVQARAVSGDISRPECAKLLSFEQVSEALLKGEQFVVFPSSSPDLDPGQLLKEWRAHGAVFVFSPKLVGDQLFVGEFRGTSIARGQRVGSKPDLFNRIRRWSAWLAPSKVLAWNIREPTKRVLYKEIRISEGAERFHRQGGRLKQQGVGNVEFGVGPG